LATFLKVEILRKITRMADTGKGEPHGARLDPYSTRLDLVSSVVRPLEGYSDETREAVMVAAWSILFGPGRGVTPPFAHPGSELRGKGRGGGGRGSGKGSRSVSSPKGGKSGTASPAASPTSPPPNQGRGLDASATASPVRASAEEPKKSPLNFDEFKRVFPVPSRQSRACLPRNSVESVRKRSKKHRPALNHAVSQVEADIRAGPEDPPSEESILAAQCLINSLQSLRIIETDAANAGFTLGRNPLDESEVPGIVPYLKRMEAAHRDLVTGEQYLPNNFLKGLDSETFGENDEEAKHENENERLTELPRGSSGNSANVSWAEDVPEGAVPEDSAEGN